MTVEEIVLSLGNRGMDRLAERLGPCFIRDAARAIVHLERGNVIVTTGFCVDGSPETDGPPGAFFVYKALEELSFRPFLAVDEIVSPLFESEVPEDRLIRFSTEDGLGFDRARAILDRTDPVLLISVERCGRNRNGVYLNVRGEDIGDRTAPIDALFLLNHSRLTTVAVGDGGNEIGMGNLVRELRQSALIEQPSVVPADHLIVSGVSNWGAYGLLAYLQIFARLDLLPSPERIESYIRTIVRRGAVDGISGIPEASVDGFPLEIEKDVARRLKEAVGRIPSPP
ncbi:MAG: DUF4392 domain-containing protein [Deltaproteobacteria bacterium]|nr:DUF4392 domain-containing protein [Deltaproteobacteria bacterium]